MLTPDSMPERIDDAELLGWDGLHVTCTCYNLRDVLAVAPTVSALSTAGRDQGTVGVQQVRIEAEDGRAVSVVFAPTWGRAGPEETGDLSKHSWRHMCLSFFLSI